MYEVFDKGVPTGIVYIRIGFQVFNVYMNFPDLSDGTHPTDKKGKI
jgi:hypothetical protein